jgi:hypothetical protein
MQTAWTALAMIAACGLVAASQSPPSGALGGQQREGHPTERDDVTTNCRRGTEAGSPVVVRVLPAEEDKAKTAREEQKERVQATVDRVTIGGNVLTVLFTAIVAGFTVGLWWIGRDTRTRQLRAYIGAHQVGFMGLEDDKPIGVGFAFVNHGLTPAQKFNLSGIIDLLPYPLPDKYRLEPAPSRPQQDGVIFPDEKDATTGKANPLTGWVWQRKPITREEKAALLKPNPTHTIYAHGVATYVDSFRKKRRTEFCFFMNPASIARDTSGKIIRGDQQEVRFQFAPSAGQNRVT